MMATQDEGNGHGSRGVIAAERRRIIYEMALRDGTVTVADLIRNLGVAGQTVRRDLDALHEEGILVRSHGGATIKARGRGVPVYSETRTAHMEQKSWIGRAALEYWPKSGMAFVSTGSTTYQLIIRVPESHTLRVMTPSPEIAVSLASRNIAPVDLLGGTLSPNSLGTDFTLSEDTISRIFWDASFIGVEAISIEHGLMCTDLPSARPLRRIAESSKKAVVLCDSSKFSYVANVSIGPVSLADVVITDNGVDPAILNELRSLGVEVVVTGPDDQHHASE